MVTVKLRRLSANASTFRPVEFLDGVNLVIADRTAGSKRTDSRNGLGKSTLVEIVNFCLGSSLTNDQNLYRLRSVEDEWSFNLELEIGGNRVVVVRSLHSPNEVLISENLAGLEVTRTNSEGSNAVKLNDWKQYLGRACFDLPSVISGRYVPSFRSLFSFFARSGRGAFVSPFRTQAQQRAWTAQVSNAYLLGLNWRVAGAWQELRDREAAVKAISDYNGGSVERIVDGLGALESERVKLAAAVGDLRAAISDFRVIPQYTDIQRRLNELTAQIKDIVSQLTLNENMIALYSERVTQEPTVDSADVVALYGEVGITLPEHVRRSVQEVVEFHREITQNRRDYLEAELRRLQSANTSLRAQLDQLESERREALQIFQTGGALDELTQLQTQFVRLSSQLETLERRLEESRRLQQGRAEIRAEKQALKQRTFVDHYERRARWSEAIEYFARTTRYLYGEPGDLIIDVTDSGYQFRTRLEREGSNGVGNMCIYSYDMALSELWSRRPNSPSLLIHDSVVFEGVDERQVARALALAARQSMALGFQYIVTLNSDNLPVDELHELDFEPQSHTVLALTDEDPSGSLLGFRF